MDHGEKKTLGTRNLASVDTFISKACFPSSTTNRRRSIRRKTRSEVSESLILLISLGLQ